VQPFSGVKPGVLIGLADPVGLCPAAPDHGARGGRDRKLCKGGEAAFMKAGPHARSAVIWSAFWAQPRRNVGPGTGVGARGSCPRSGYVRPYGRIVWQARRVRSAGQLDSAEA